MDDGLAIGAAVSFGDIDQLAGGVIGHVAQVAASGFKKIDGGAVDGVGQHLPRLFCPGDDCQQIRRVIKEHLRFIGRRHPPLIRDAS